MAPSRICSFESRRSTEIATLIEKFGGQPFVAPSMQEVPLDAHAAVWEFWEKLKAGQIDLFILLTGVGVRQMMKVLETKVSQEDVLEQLNRVEILVRSPKPHAVMREWKTRVDYRVPEPNTWRELVSLIDETPIEVAGKLVAVQEYGQPNPELYSALEERKANLLPVSIYQWEMPDDTTALSEAVHGIIAGEFDLLMFTSAQQVVHLLKQAERMDRLDDLKHGMRQVPIASIGPTCSERLADFDFEVAMEPSHPKMGHLVREALEFLSRSK